MQQQGINILCSSAAIGGYAFWTWRGRPGNRRAPWTRVWLFNGRHTFSHVPSRIPPIIGWMQQVVVGQQTGPPNWQRNPSGRHTAKKYTDLVFLIVDNFLPRCINACTGIAAAHMQQPRYRMYSYIPSSVSCTADSKRSFSKKLRISSFVMLLAEADSTSITTTREMVRYCRTEAMDD